MDLAIQCITKKYATFAGRARRKEYWLYVLLYFIMTLVLAAIGASLGSEESRQSLDMLSTVIGLVLLLPTLAVTARRLHDTNRSGWWMLIAFLPIIGTIWLLVLMVLPGTNGPNKHGEDPLDGSWTAPDQTAPETP